MRSAETTHEFKEYLMIVIIIGAYDVTINGDNQRPASFPPHATDPSLPQAFSARMKSVTVSAHLNHWVTSGRCYELQRICNKCNTQNKID